MLHLFFYRLFLLVYLLGIRIATLQNKKAQLWINGRKNWRKKIEAQISTLQHTSSTVWIHCASLGEFEQGRPLIERLKTHYPETRIILTFFSPSGYEVMKNYKHTDVICYLPMDSATNAKDFIAIIKPSLVLWVKYEYWHYYLNEIYRQNIQLLLISGIFRKDQPFFKWYGKLYRDMLETFSYLFVQNEESAILAAKILNKKNISINGDTRFDRVIEIEEKFEPISIIEQWIGSTTQVLVAGSTWDEDDEELAHYVKLHPEIKFIIAPHNINEEEIKDTLKIFPGAVLYSSIENTTVTNTTQHVLIIDNIGMLARLYHYATIAYIGGGFGDDGIHNVLEAAVYSKPVVHGPEYEKYVEANGLIEAGGAFEIEDALALEKILDRLFTDKDFYNIAAKAAGKFVHAHKGSTEKIIDYIRTNDVLS